MNGMKRVIEKVRYVLSENKMDKVPIDVYQIAKNHKISVHESSSLPEDISGALDLRDFNQVIILVNQAHHEYRKRFTIAHELGHFFLHKTSGVHIDKRILFRDTASTRGTNIIEIEANRFAAEILMPEDLLKLDLESIQDFQDENELKQISDKYKVSLISLSFRIGQLKKLNMMW